MQIGRHILTRRFQVADHRHFFAHAFVIINRPFHFSGMRNGQEVQHCIGGATGGHNHGDGVFYGTAGNDVARPEVTLDGFNQHAGGLGCRNGLFFIRIGHRGRVHQGHAECFERRRHGVGGIHAAAGTGRGTGIPFYAFKIFIRHFAGCELTHGFKGRHNGQVLALPVARLDGAAIDIDARHIGTCQRDHPARHIFIAATNHDTAIEPLALYTGLYAISNHFA